MSVAIRAVTRAQDLDDFGSVPGAGNDGYVWTWDNGAGAFVLTEMAASGLAADGSVTGATAQAQLFTNGIIGPSWKPSANSTTALQLQNAAGANVLNVDTTNGRVGIGTSAPVGKIDIVHSGYPVLRVERSTTETGNQFGLTNFGIASAILLKTTTSGDMTDGFGGGFIFGVGDNSVSADSNFVARIYGRRDSADNIGAIEFYNGSDDKFSMIIRGSGNVGIGTTEPGSRLHALLTSGATNAVTNVVTIGHDTRGTAAAGFGAGQLFALESSTTAAQNAARILALWNDATHATRKADLVGTAYDAGGEREGWRVRGNGSAAAFSVLGADPIARKAHVADPAGGATVDAEARSAINSILATLEGFGFHATS